MKQIRVFFASIAIVSACTYASRSCTRFYSAALYVSSSSTAPSPSNSVALTGYCSLIGFTTVGVSQVQFADGTSPNTWYAYGFDGTTFIRLYAAGSW